MRPWLAGLFALVVVLVVAVPAGAVPAANARLDRSDVVYAVNADQTYSETATIDRTLLTTRGIQSHDRSAITYYPDQQKPGRAGSLGGPARRQPAAGGPDEGRFTRPSASSQQAPGFTGSLTTTIVYPQLRPGSRTHIKFRRVQLNAAAARVQRLVAGGSGGPGGSRTGWRSTCRPALALNWRSRGAVAVTDKVEGDRRRIVAEMAPSPGP